MKDVFRKILLLECIPSLAPSQDLTTLSIILTYNSYCIFVVCTMILQLQLTNITYRYLNVNKFIMYFFFISYNPFDGPNENPEAELPLTAGEYIYIYGDMDDDGFYEGK